jgi:uncharacterized cupredoxin-like copper-binding protein
VRVGPKDGFPTVDGRESLMKHGLMVFAAIAAVGMITEAKSVSATTIVNVELGDTSTADGVQGMEMKLDRNAANAGTVTFHVTNDSKGLVHEMIVIRGDSAPSALPYDAKEDRVIESKVKSLGEVSELPPGKSGSLTLKMAPGKYLLICNQPGHLHMGMWSSFTVNTPAS